MVLDVGCRDSEPISISQIQRVLEYQGVDAGDPSQYGQDHSMAPSPSQAVEEEEYLMAVSPCFRPRPKALSNKKKPAPVDDDSPRQHPRVNQLAMKKKGAALNQVTV